MQSASKNIMFIGIALLIVGIFLRIYTDLYYLGLAIILLGAFFKMVYLIKRIKTGIYKPGFEFALLLVGLLLFSAGFYIKNSNLSINSAFFLIPGLILKVLFVILFIKKNIN